MIKQTVLVCALALGLGACATGPGYNDRGSYGYNDRGSHGYNDGGSYGGNRYASCQSCGVVERIEQNYGDRRTSGGGAVAGAIIGGVLGNQVGSGSGRAVATAAGVVAGGVAGNEIEKNTSGSVRYDLFVRMDDGRRLVVSQRDLRGIREGSRIQVSGNSARLY